MNPMQIRAEIIHSQSKAGCEIVISATLTCSLGRIHVDLVNHQREWSGCVAQGSPCRSNSGLLIFINIFRRSQSRQVVQCYATSRYVALTSRTSGYVNFKKSY